MGRVGIRYSYEELEMIRAGICPPGRKLKYVKLKAIELGCPFARSIAPKWTEAEIECLKKSQYPLTRSRHACWTKAHKLGIEFHPSGPGAKFWKANAAKNHDAIVEEVRRTGKVRATARKFGVSYTYVSEAAKAAGITRNASPKDCRGPSIKWEGSTWVWCVRTGGHDCQYWRETSGRRRNLARVIYEEAFGPLPRDYVVFFKNGDRMDLRTENLAAMSRSEYMAFQRLDPMVDAKMRAGGILGRLNRTIKEQLDPSLVYKRIDKTVAKRRKNGSYGNRKK